MTERKPTFDLPEPDKIVASYSSLTSHRGCPQAWMYRYHFDLGKPTTGPAPELNFGSWWGLMAGADALVRGRQHDSLKWDPRTIKPIDGYHGFDQKDLTPRDVLLACIEWWKDQDNTVRDAWDERLGGSAPARLKAVYTRWKDEWGEDQKHERPLGLEVFWKRRVPRPTENRDWINQDDFSFESLPEVWLLGYIDQIYYDTRRDMIIISDDKSSKDLPKFSAREALMDSQLQLYPWGVTPQLIERQLPRATAIRYDRVLSKAPAQPKLTQSGTLSTTSKNWDLRTYREWIANRGPVTDEEGNPVLDEQGKQVVADRLQHFPGRAKDGSQAGVYEEDPEVVARITDEGHRRMFFQRPLSPVNPNVVSTHLQSAIDTSTDIWRTKARIDITGAAGRNLGGGCTWCDYKTLCLAQMIGGTDGEYDLAEHGLVQDRKGGATTNPTFSTIPVLDTTTGELIDL